MVIAMSRIKMSFGFSLLVVSMLLFIVPILAQEGDSGGENSFLEQFRLCQEARQELREAGGTPINPDDLPAVCRQNHDREARPFAACRAAIRELRSTSDERVTREDIQEIEVCAGLSRFNDEEDAPAALSSDGEQPLWGQRERRYGSLGSRDDGERGQRSMPCLDALQVMRDAGERVTRETMPEVCQTFLSPDAEAAATD
jgi:hypothetical protein